MAAGPMVDDDVALGDAAVALAAQLLAASLEDETSSERRARTRLGRILASPSGRDLTFALTDEVLRLPDHRAAARRFASLVSEHGTQGFGALDARLLRAGAGLARRWPRLVMPIVIRRIVAETHGVVLPADDPALARHLRRRTGAGVRANVNALGEAILSDAEADARFARVLADIARPDVDYVSVKVSSLVANLDEVAFDWCVDRICSRLAELFDAGASSLPATFVNIDMEEYRDLDLSIEAFKRVLSDRPALDAGIVVQAYLPDAQAVTRDLCEWAVSRHDRGGGRLKIRLVKGANLAMERVTSELHGWQQAPYGTKREVDANYKAVLDGLFNPTWGDAVRVGLASHNLFDIAWAMVRGQDQGASGRIEFEMLEGMAPAQSRQVHGSAGALLVYSPVVARDDFDAALAYLTRRLDENTQPGNFLTDLFELHPNSPEFARQEAAFRESVASRHHVPKRRGRALVVAPSRLEFANEPDTDFTDPAVRVALNDALSAEPLEVPESLSSAREVEAVVAKLNRGGPNREAPRRWLLGAAELMAIERFPTIGHLVRNGAKTVREADAEISEAIDFCHYYATEGQQLLNEAGGVEIGPLGSVAVVGPWNFPYAIPTGGVAGALAAGNSVILKPAPETAAIGAWIVDQFRRAGVPQERLQLVVCPDGAIGRTLIEHLALETVVLTGALETAEMFHDWMPGRRLLAETSGKNAIVITPSADLDLAIADLVHSAFSHAGQKCSAASLAILVGSVGHDARFRNRLAEAVRSLRVGPPDRLDSMVGPLITAPSGKLQRGLSEPGSAGWVVEPECIDPDLHVWRPGVMADVEPDSWFHTTECFGPVLGLMRAETLEDAVELQNATPFGLTGGLHSLDPKQISYWLENAEVGNAYVNRGITGAVVRRQPFGGWKASSVGGGAKPGGPHYVAQLATLRDEPNDRVERARASFRDARETWFRRDHDPSALSSEANILRYHPHLAVVAIQGAGADETDLALLRLAAGIVGTELDEFESDDLATIRRHLIEHPVDRVRVLGAIPEAVLRSIHAAGVPVDTTPPVADGRLELIRWHREQAISTTLHRHGRLPAPTHA